MNDSIVIDKKEYDTGVQHVLPPFTPEDFLVPNSTPTNLVSASQNLFRVLANQQRFRSFNEGVSALLNVGQSVIAGEAAFLLKHLSDYVYEVQAKSSVFDFFIGQHISLNFESISHDNKKNVFIGDKITQFASPTEVKEYNYSRTTSCVGVSFTLSNNEHYTVCFVSASPLSFGSSEKERIFLESMAEGIACMTELQKVRALRKNEDLAISTTGSIKSLEEYRQLADLPEGMGISGKVVDVLKKRIGRESLSIDNIADELNLSKRTLQRRLQQQNVSFAELRDTVRFHYSIGYLVSQQISIDRISSTLDFSDRTSFTNAFKRWTGLSPSTFRKVFRDYA